MIQTPLSQAKISDALSQLDLSQASELIRYAGFADASGFHGQPRQTFSLLLTQADIAYLESCMRQLYAAIQAGLEVKPPTGSIPFDFIRIDAYYDAAQQKLQILEINSHDAGLHEIGEWLDDKTGTVLGAPATKRLNDLIANNHYAWQQAHLGDFDRAVFFSRAGIPRWLYYQALQRRYPNLAAVSSWDGASFEADGIHCDGQTYRAVITKADGGRPQPVRALDDAGTIALVQSRHNGYIGHKKYLEALPFDFVAHAEAIDQTLHDDYRQQRADLVLKKNVSSGSRGVIVGRGVSESAWAEALQQVYVDPSAWTMQRYADPGAGSVIAHGQPTPACRTQLGIFVLPNPDDPSECTIDLVVKGYVGSDEAVMFDPAGYKPDIWFGNVIVTDTDQ